MSVKYRSIPTKTLAQNLSSSGTTLYLNNTLDWDDAQLSSSDFGTQAFALLRNASNTQIELIEIDPTTVTSAAAITISKRGLGYDGTQSANTETKYNWSAFDTYVELGSDTPQMLQYLKDYIDGIAIAGVSDASLTAKGIVEIATQAEVDSGDDTGSTTAPAVVSPSTIRAKMFHDYAADSVGTDAYAITITPAITAYATGQIFTFKAGTANTGACTLAVSGLTAKAIVKNYNEPLVTGDILANQIVTVCYDGTSMQVISKLPSPTPSIQTFTTASTTLGSTTTQFDITNTAGSTYRYTWDGNGTDPAITAVSVPTGSVILIESSSMNDVNTGSFVVTGSANNYFEVSNSAGSAEVNVNLTDGYLKLITPQTYTKPTGLKYAIVEVQGAGAAGAGIGGNNDGSGIGGGAGAYSKKLIAGSSLGATETLYVGPGGISPASSSFGTAAGSLSKFGSHITAPGGGTPAASGNVTGGTATGGDLNISGGSGWLAAQNASTSVRIPGGYGGASFLGLGGSSRTTDGAGSAGTGYGSGGGAAFGDSSSSAAAGGAGAPGVIIVTEYYS